jgi:MarR family transcriptional regulator, 2-MHQ and catechol-resistance regulon repressor
MTQLCELVSLLGHVQQCVSKEIEDALRHENLSTAKYNILSVLDEEGGRVPFSTLVERLGCVRSNVTGLIDRLQDDHLVRRVDHPEDRRMLFAELTDEGKALIAVAKPRYDAAIERAFTRLDQIQRETLREMLGKLSRKPIVESEHDALPQ